MNEQILDQPESLSGSKQAHQGWTQRLNAIDYLINLLLLALIATSSLIGLASTEGLFLALVGMLFLGSYQLLSALIGAIRGNRSKLIYLLAAIAYLVMCLGSGMILEKQGAGGDFAVSMFVLGMVISFFGACYYTYLCYQAKIRTAL